MNEMFPTDWFSIGFYICMGVLFVAAAICEYQSRRAMRPDPELDKANAEYEQKLAELLAMCKGKPRA